jgi:hypothetical protein
MPTGLVIYAKIATNIDPRAPWDASMRSETWVAMVKANGYTAISLTPPKVHGHQKLEWSITTPVTASAPAKQTAQTLGRDPLRKLCAKPRRPLVAPVDPIMMQEIGFARDSPLEGSGFELLVRGRGEAGCRAF